MTTFETLRAALRKRAAFNRTRQELKSLPREIAIEDLGLIGDADEIAYRAVYG